MELDVSRISRQVSSMAWPAILHALLNTTLYFVDTVMIGRLGEEPLAASGLCNSITWSVSMFFFALATAALALSARGFGARDTAEVRRVTASSLVSALFIGILAATAACLAAGPIISQFIDDGAVRALAVPYFRILFCSFPFLYLARVMVSLLNSTGDTVSPMKVIVVINVLNIAADYGLIFGKFGLPEMGLNGAAAATLACRVVQFSLLLGVLVLRPPFNLRPAHVGLVDIGTLRRLFRVCLPAALEAAVIHSGFLVFFKIVASLGSLPLAAHHIALSVESLSFMFGVGLSVAAASIVGQNLGAGSPEGASFGAGNALKKCLVIMTVIGGGLFFFPEQLIRLFTRAPEIVALGAAVLRIGAFEQPFLGAYMVLTGSLRGAGETFQPMVVAILGSWIFRVPLVYFLTITLDLRLPGVWFGTCADWLFRAAIMYYLFKKGTWKRVRV